MGNLRIYILLIAIAVFSTACKKEDPKQPEPAKTLSISFSEKTVSSTPTTFTIEVQSNCDWKISSNADWISILPSDTLYHLSVALTIKVEANDKTDQRVAKLNFQYNGKEEILTITQDAFDVYLDISLSEITFGYRTAEKNILITSNCGWYAKASANWIAIKPSTGLIGNFDMNINVETNNEKRERNGDVHIWNEEYSIDRYIAIHQSGNEKVNDKHYIDEYGIDWGEGIMIRGLTWAPVNCGYEEADFPLGKLYQWGRKYGLGYQDSEFQDISSPNISDIWQGENGYESATTFYKYADGSKFNYDWIYEGNDSFWNHGTEENPVKNAQFDPCPVGWRIPTAFEFKSLIGYVNREWNNISEWNGYLFFEDVASDDLGNAPSTLFLPAGGRLNVVDGMAYDRNIEAYYWTNTASDGNSAYLYFYNEDCSINYQGSRAGGCLIRCIKE